MKVGDRVVLSDDPQFGVGTIVSVGNDGWCIVAVTAGYDFREDCLQEATSEEIEHWDRTLGLPQPSED